MSDKKFNLKHYQKINGDEHIDMRLEQERKDAPNVINEKQLDVGRVEEKNVIVEKLLDDKRTGAETETTEKRLDTHKAKFSNKYRNPSAFEGDINKLEEKRLENDPVEKEKYASAAETPTQFRWWEDVKSPDGLKLAQKKSALKTAQYDPGELGEVYESLALEEPEYSEKRLKDYDEFNVQDLTEKTEKYDEDIDEKEPEEMAVDTVRIVSDRDIYQPKRPDLSGIYFKLNFDPREFPIDLYINKDRPEAAASDRKQAIMDEAIVQISEKRPDLGQKLAEDLKPFDYFVIDERNGTIKAALVGEQWIPYMKDLTSTPAMMGGKKDRMVGNETNDDELAELSYEEKNVDGTPMAIGKIKLLEEGVSYNPEALANMTVEFIRKKHPDVDISKDALDFSKIDAGEILYMSSVSPEASKERGSAEEKLEAEESKWDEFLVQPKWKQLGYDSSEEWAEDNLMGHVPQDEEIQEDIPITDLEDGPDEYTETEEEWKARLKQMEEDEKAKGITPKTSAVKKN